MGSCSKSSRFPTARPPRIGQNELTVFPLHPSPGSPCRGFSFSWKISIQQKENICLSAQQQPLGWRNRQTTAHRGKNFCFHEVPEFLANEIGPQTTNDTAQVDCDCSSGKHYYIEPLAVASPTRLEIFFLQFFTSKTVVVSRPFQYFSVNVFSHSVLAPLYFSQWKTTGVSAEMIYKNSRLFDMPIVCTAAPICAGAF